MATLTEKLNAALSEIDALKAELSESQKSYEAESLKRSKEREAEKSSREYQSKLMEVSKLEVETLHVVFDSLPNSIGRKTAGENSWDQKDIPAIARLCAYLETRGNP